MKLSRMPVVLLLYISPTLLLSAVSTDETGLLLSPYIDSGDLDNALKLSQVHLSNHPLVSSHAGYITVDRKNLFFWYFKSHETSSPLLVWLGESLGVSALQSLFLGHGPFRYQQSDIGRQVSWSTNFSVVYIDSPEGTGYSYSDRNSKKYFTKSTGRDIYDCLSQLYTLFPNFTDKELYIGGQGYAAKFAVRLGSIIDQNNNTRMNLKGLFLDEPLLKPEVSTKESINFLFNIGALSKAEQKRFTRRIETTARRNLSSLETIFRNVMPEVAKHANLDNFVTRYMLNRSDFDSAIRNSIPHTTVHANASIDFNSFERDVYNKFGRDFFIDYDEQFGTLMEKYNVLVYSGTFSGYNPGVEKLLEELNWSKKFEYSNATRRPWEHENTFYGFFSSVGKLCRAILHKSGHNAALDQPEIVLKLLLDFTRQGCVNTTLDTTEV